MEEKGIKETMDLLEGVEVLAISFTKVLKDGKINVVDLPVLLDLFKNAGVLIESVKNISDIPGEISDLQREELIEIGSKIYEIVRKIKKQI